jgi:hypothetical protein
MGGSKWSQQILNDTLTFIIKLLNDNNINNWFIAYGTLLGIARENSCINGDDDIDIVIDNTNYEKVKNMLADNGIEVNYNYNNRTVKSKDILKTKEVQDTYCSVDFYMASLDENGNFRDKWEGVTWSKCYDANNNLIEYMWNENKLYLPFNYETKIINRYGENWKTPQNNKGPTPRKGIL